MELDPGNEATNTMTQDVFNLMARSVNKEFVHLGYPSILTKKSGRDFVSLCALMNNCSALLASVKTKSDQAAATLDASAKFSRSAAAQQKKGRGGGIFSSRGNSKQQSEEVAAVYEGILEKVKQDTEEVIETTRCLPEPGDHKQESAAVCGDQQQQQQAPDQLLVFFATRWVQFKDTITRKVLEAGQLAVEVQSLRTALGRALPRSKSASGDATAMTTAATDFIAKPRQRSLSRPPESHVSVTKIPSLEAEIRRLKLELTRREQRHKDELDRQAKERERLGRDFRHAQRRITGPRWPINAHNPASQPPLLPAQPIQQQQNSNDVYDQVVTYVCQMLDKLVECLGSSQQQLKPDLDRKQSSQRSQLNHLQAYVDSVCNAALSRIASLQADCSASRRRQADLEVLVSILKARLDLTNDEVSDVAKFEAALTEIAQRLCSAPESGCGGARHSDAPVAAALSGDEPRDSLVSRLTSRLRERQRPQ